MFSHCFSFISGYDDKLPWQSYSKKESECMKAFALAGAYLLLALMQSGVQFLKWCCSRSGWGLPTSTSLKPIKKIPQRHANRPTQARQVRLLLRLSSQVIMDCFKLTKLPITNSSVPCRASGGAGLNQELPGVSTPGLQHNKSNSSVACYAAGGREQDSQPGAKTVGGWGWQWPAL